MLIASPSGFRVLLLCAGDGSRWGEYLGIPKQLIAFGGETLLSRTVRLLTSTESVDITCVTCDSRLSISSTTSFFPSACAFLVETLQSTRPLWNDRTVVLLGDVFYTERAIERIMGFQGACGVFGRPWPSSFVKCNHGELFALSFVGESATHMLAVSRETLALARRGARGNLWDFYHVLMGLPFNRASFEARVLQPIDDITNDFDTPDDYENAKALYDAATSTSPLRRVRLTSSLLLRAPMHVIGRVRHTLAAGRSPTCVDERSGQCDQYVTSERGDNV